MLNKQLQDDNGEKERLTGLIWSSSLFCPLFDCSPLHLLHIKRSFPTMPKHIDTLGISMIIQSFGDSIMVHKEHCPCYLT